MTKRLRFILAIITILAILAPKSVLAAAGDTIRVSVMTDGTEQTGNSSQPSISADGRYVAFESANALVAGDTNGVVDIFVRDRDTDADGVFDEAGAVSTTRVSVATGGGQANGASHNPSISGDGAYVAFESVATNLVANDTNGVQDIFVYDRNTNVTERVSIATDSSQANGDSYYASLAGNRVAFESDASNLVSGDTNGVRDVFMHDRSVGTTIRVSVDSSGVQGNNTSQYAAITSNGAFVAYQSMAMNLISGDTNGYSDIFVYETATGITTLASISSSGTQGNDWSTGAYISIDGRYVVFESAASTLVSGDTNSHYDVFVRDRTAGTTVRASVSSGGTQGALDSTTPTISGDGRYVTFQTSNALTGSDTNGMYDVYVHDTSMGTTSLVSMSTGGTVGNRSSSSGVISANGQFVSFYSASANLVTGDTDIDDDVFVHELGTVVDTTPPTTSITSHPSSSTRNPIANFSFTGADNITLAADLTFSCSIDGGAYSTCTSPWSSTLADGSHTFQVYATDAAGNSDLTPASFTWTIDSTAPVVTIDSINPNPTGAGTTVIWHASESGSYQVRVGGTSCSSTPLATYLITSGAYTTPTSMTTNIPGTRLVSGDNTIRVCVTDSFSNVGYATGTVTQDTTVPTLVSITRQNPSATATNEDTLVFRVIFSESVQNMQDAIADFTVNGTTTATVTDVTAVNTYTYDITVSGGDLAGFNGTVGLDLTAGQNIIDQMSLALPAGEPATDQLYTLDNIAPTVTINQASGQADPTNISPVNFTAVFSEPVIGFASGDISLDGTAGPTTAEVTETGALDGTTYTVAVSGMPNGGTVMAEIPANSVQDAALNENTSSTSDDNTVIFTVESTTTLTSDLNPAGVGSSVTFTATVAMAGSGSVTPTGNVEFLDGGSSLGTSTLNASGIATLSTSSLAVGSHTITAVYAGIPSLAGSTSPDLIQVIEGAPSVSLINSNAATGDGELVEDEHTNAGITQLLVVFSKAMEHGDPVDAGDVRNPSNYTLMLGGSTSIEIDSITYDAAALTATLNINGGTALPSGEYTLTVDNAIVDTLGSPLEADYVRNFVIDSGYPFDTSIETIQGNRAVTNGATIDVRFSSIQITFNEDLNNSGGGAGVDDASNPLNYILLQSGANAAYDTASCAAFSTNGNLPLGDDIRIPTGSVTYENHGGTGPFVSTVQFNGGTVLPNGAYRLLICGTTSIVDLVGNALNNGADTQVNFTVLVTSSVTSNPKTGFAPDRITVIPEQPSQAAYSDPGNLWIEIPALHLMTTITGIPLNQSGWDLTWLNHQVGWLDGTAYPTWAGNSVLTAHAYTADGLPGPFANLGSLVYNDTIIVHLDGMSYTYVLQTNDLVDADNTSAITRHEEEQWLTLITCQQYDEHTGSYLYRRVVRAVLVKVE